MHKSKVEAEDPETGEGCLEGMRCPECGQTTQFRIMGTTISRESR